MTKLVIDSLTNKRKKKKSYNFDKKDTDFDIISQKLGTKFASLNQ